MTPQVHVVNIAEKLRQFEEHWQPKIVGELNDSYVKLVKFQGEFVWHHHDDPVRRAVRRGYPSV